MSRTGRFQPLLIPPKDKSTIYEDGLTCFKHLVDSSQQLLTDIDRIGSFVFILNHLRRPENFMGGPVSFSIPEAFRQNGRDKLGSSTPCMPPSKLMVDEWLELLESVAFKDPCQKTPLLLGSLKSRIHAKLLSKKEPKIGFIDFLCHVSHRSIPLAVNRALWGWQLGVYPLQCLTYIPTPLELLEMQSKGFRCVSLITDYDFTVANHGRDPLGFVLHDLIHADHFFKCQELAESQIIFSQKILIGLKKGEFSPYWEKDPTFKKEFTYLISDMNSHPQHLEQTLTAIMNSARMRAQNKVGDDLTKNIQY